MAVDDLGQEVLKKVAEEVIPGSKADYYLKFKNPAGQPIDIEGSFTFTGLSIGMKTSTIEVTDIATPLPAIPRPQRNSLLVRNLSTGDTIYIGEANVTAGRNVGSITDGQEIDAGQEFSVDIANGLPIYAIADAGKTVLVKVTEYA